MAYLEVGRIQEGGYDPPKPFKPERSMVFLWQSVCLHPLYALQYVIDLVVLR